MRMKTTSTKGCERVRLLASTLGFRRSRGSSVVRRRHLIEKKKEGLVHKKKHAREHEYFARSCVIGDFRRAFHTSLQCSSSHPHGSYYWERTEYFDSSTKEKSVGYSASAQHLLKTTTTGSCCLAISDACTRNVSQASTYTTTCFARTGCLFHQVPKNLAISTPYGVSVCGTDMSRMRELDALSRYAEEALI